MSCLNISQIMLVGKHMAFVLFIPLFTNLKTYFLLTPYDWYTAVKLSELVQ